MKVLTERYHKTCLIRAGGNLSEVAYTLSAEVTRHEVVNGISREIDHLTLDLAAILAGDRAADLPLKSYDRLTIRPIPKWAEQETVEVIGEVNFPGTYSISRNETLSSLLRRAGDLTADAFPSGAVFTREELRKLEQQRIDDLANRMENSLAAAQLTQAHGAEFQRSDTGSDGTQALTIGRQLVQQLRATTAVGRLVIDLPALFSGPKVAVLGEGRYSELDVILKGGDRLVIPRDTQEVSVIGEVYYPTSHLYQKGLDRSDYIDKSGGFTQSANKSQIYVVQASGNVVSSNAGILFGWLPVLGNRTILPGDTVVVPLDAEKVRPLAFWGEITKIMYEIALSAAALKTVGAL